jgi:hypothetical protein
MRALPGCRALHLVPLKSTRSGSALLLACHVKGLFIPCPPLFNPRRSKLPHCHPRTQPPRMLQLRLTWQRRLGRAL